MTSIVNARQFVSNVQFLGRKHRCLSIIPKGGDSDLVCIPDAETWLSADPFIRQPSEELSQ
jgi:hypothetical protein